MFNINDHEAEILGIQITDHTAASAYPRSNLLKTIDLKHNNLVVHLKIHRDATHFIIDLQQSLRPNYEEFEMYTYESDEVWKNIPKMIRVSINKPLTQVFNEIKRRFDWGKLAEYFEKLQKEHETHRKHIDDHKELCNKIAQEFKGKRIHIKKSEYRTDYTRFSLMLSLECQLSTITVNRNSSVDFSINSVKNPHIIEEIVKVLAKFSKETPK